MTNSEKFKEVFGWKLEGFVCPSECPPYTPNCAGCKYNDWQNQEYKPPHPDQEKEDKIKFLNAEIARLREANEDLHNKRYNDCLENIKLKSTIVELATKLFGGE